MKANAFRDAVRQLGLWILLVLGVAVSTILFNILGVISASVVAGMAMAASRRWRWHVVPVSLVFPLIGLALAQVSKGGLESGQRMAMVVLCFGAFWAIYLPSLMLMRMEKEPLGESDSTDPKSSANLEPGEPDRASEGKGPASQAAVVALETADAEHGLGVHDFEGTWFCERNGPNGEFRTCLMAVKKDRFTMEIRNSRGLVQQVTEGVIKLNGVASARSKLIPALPARSPVPPG